MPQCYRDFVLTAGHIVTDFREVPDLIIQIADTLQKTQGLALAEGKTEALTEQAAGQKKAPVVRLSDLQAYCIANDTVYMRSKVYQELQEKADAWDSKTHANS